MTFDIGKKRHKKVMKRRKVMETRKKCHGNVFDCEFLIEVGRHHVPLWVIRKAYKNALRNYVPMQQPVITPLEQVAQLEEFDGPTDKGLIATTKPNE